MKNLKLYIAICCAAVFSSCIKNDLPYGKIPLSITSLSVSGQIGESVISEKDMTVKINLEETANPVKTQIINVEYKATLRDNSENDYHNKIVSNIKKDDVIDLSSPFNVKLSLFQEYNWSIIPNQSIERIFKVEKQMSNPIFDYEKKIAIAYIQKDVDLKDARLLELKLGPKGCTHNGVSEGLPVLEWKLLKNYNEAKVNVTFSDFINEDWTIRIYNFDKDLTKAVYGGTRIAWAYGISIEGKNCGFEYRKDGDSEWISVPENDIIMESSEFNAIIKGLEPNTKYYCRAKVGDIYGAELEFSTTGEVEIPNFGFEDWSQNGKVICPWASGSDTFWDTGNWGSTTLSDKDNITTYVSDAYAGNYAAKLESRSVAGIFASGNLFIGKYKKTVGMNGNLGFGRAYSAFPVKLTGYYKYKSATITKPNTGYEDMKDKPDTGIIWVALVSGAPDEYGTFVNILTNKDDSSKGEYFNKDADNVIAYGEFLTEGDIEEYKKFTVDLEYKKIGVKPDAIIIVASSSKLGDYFTGGVGSTLWIDEFKLHYDN